MNTKTLFAALLMGAACVACGPKGEAAAEEDAPVEQKTAADLKPSKARVDSVSYLVGINFGSFIKGYGFGDLNQAQVKKGMMDFIKAKGTPRDEDFGAQFAIDPQAMNDLFNAYLEQMSSYTGAINSEKETKFLEANKKKNGVEVSESGLQYKIIDLGNSDLVPSLADTVWVNYKGTLIDGTTFDESPEGEPVQFTLNRVIAGWQEGLQLIGEGGKIELTIPSALGYGEMGTQGIEPYSTLLFTTELVKVGKFIPAAAEEE